MFKRAKKKTSQPVSRAGSYILGESCSEDGPNFDISSFSADSDFFMSSSFVRQGLNSDSSNAENESICSSGTSEEGASVKKRQRKKGLTFSTFLGTPKISRRNKGDDSDDYKAIKYPEKDTSSRSMREDISDSKHIQEKQVGATNKIQESTAAKKQSVMSKFKHALTTPKSQKKVSKISRDASFTQSLQKGKGKPPPPPPKRISSLTSVGLEYNDTDIGRHYGCVDEKICSEMDHIITPVPNEEDENVLLTPPEQETTVKTLSLDVDNINLTMSDTDKCDTLQSMDDISDDEACVSISSGNSHSQVSDFSKSIVEHNHHNITESELQIKESEAKEDPRGTKSNNRVEKSNAITSELNFYLQKIKEKSNDLRKESVLPDVHGNMVRKPMPDSVNNNSKVSPEVPQLLAHAKTPCNTIIEESMFKLEQDQSLLEPEDSIFINEDVPDSSENEDEDSNQHSAEIDPQDLPPESIRDEVETALSPNGLALPPRDRIHPSHNEKISEEIKVSTLAGSRKQECEENDIKGDIFDMHQREEDKQMENIVSPEIMPVNIVRGTESYGMHNEKESVPGDNVISRKIDSVADDTPIAPPRHKRNSLSKARGNKSLQIAAEQININGQYDSDVSNDAIANTKNNTSLQYDSDVSHDYSDTTDKNKNSFKPPLTPKPNWVKESLKNGKSDRNSDIKTKQDKGEKEGHKSGRSSSSRRPATLTVLRGSVPQSCSSSCYSDSDTHSSSSYDGKPPKAMSRLRRQEKISHEDTTDDEIVTLKPQSNRSKLTSRSSTPTSELYCNVSGAGPVARSVPSPCPDSQHVLVEEDYLSESEGKPKKNSNQISTQSPNQRGRSMTKSMSLPMNLSLADLVDRSENIKENYVKQYSPPLQKVTSPHSTPQSPVHHCVRVDMDIDISNEICTPKSSGPDAKEMFDIRHRAVTPSIEQIRSYQRSRSAANDILVENLRYRPSTPLIGGSTIKLKEYPNKSKEVFKKRLSTPILSGRNLSTVDIMDNDLTNPVDVSRIDVPRYPGSPMKSHPMDMYKSGFATDTSSHSNVYGSVADQWSSFNNNSAQDRRPPSPVLRARVNSVLDSLISRPIGHSISRSPLIRSQSVDRLLTNSSLGPPTPSLEGYLTPRGTPRISDDLVFERSSRPGTPSLPLRPPSPFQMPPPLSRMGYFDSEIDVEFPTPPHWISQRVLPSNPNNTPLHQSSSVPNLYEQSNAIVPPLNLDFTRQKSEEGEVSNPDVFQVSIRSPPRPNKVSDTHFGDKDSQRKVGGGPKAGTRQVVGPDYNKERSHRVSTLPPRQSSHSSVLSRKQDSIDGIILKDDDELDVSTACLELSNPASSDSEGEDDVISCQKAFWQFKSAELWSISDVVDWCLSNNFYKTALVLKENAVTGAELLQMSGRYLADLGLQDDRERQEFMSEVEKLRLKPRSAASLWRLKQTSMKRRNLEASSELLKERLYNLQQLSSHQNQRINTSMEEVIQHQRQTDELLGIRDEIAQNGKFGNDGTSELGQNAGLLPEIQIDVPLIKWTKEDVTTWLKASDLGRFTERFQAYNVTGKELAAVDMQLLDKLGIDSTEDRELFLSKLYDLQRPLQGSSQEEMVASQGVDLKTPIPSEERETGSQSSRDGNSENHVMENNGDFSNPKTVNGSNKHTSLQNKFKDIVSPRKFGVRHKEMDTIRIWHDVSGTSMSTELKISESTTSEDVVMKVLQDLEITDDINLFFLTVSSPYIEEGEKELGKFECPLSVQRSSQNGTCRFDLRRRLGITIKVICQVSNMKPRGKGFRVSPYSTCTEVLQVALRKFGMSHVDPNLFCLLPINKETGDVRMLNDQEVVQDCESDAFILSNHENTNHLLASPDTLPFIQQSKQILRRNSSLNSHGSSGLSQSSETSQGSDSGKPRNEKLESLEAMMADIEASLSAKFHEEELQKADMINSLPAKMHHTRSTSAGHYNHQTDFVPPLSQFNTSRYVTPRKQKLPSSDKYIPQDLRSDEHLELMREIALMRESVQERDNTISNLKKQIDNLKTHNKEVVELKSQLYEMQMRQKDVESQWQEQLTSVHRELEVKQHQLENANQALQAEQQKVRLHEDDDSDSGRETNRSTRGSMPGSTTDLSLDIDQLERELEVIQSDVRSQEDQLTTLRSRQQKAVEESRLSGNTINVQLLGEDCTIVEAKLLRAKQKHADIYAKLELTKKELARNRQGQGQVPSLYELLSPDAPQNLVCVELSNTDGPGFIHGRDSYHRLIIKHVAENQPLQKSDRILEVNNQRVFHMEDQEFAVVLRQARKPLKLVLVRDKESNRSRHSDQDIEAMKEDLAMAMIEVESAQQENQDLTEEVERLKENNRKIIEENESLRQEIQNMKKQMEETELEQDRLKSSLLKLEGNVSSSKKKTRFGDDFCSGSTDSENGRPSRSSTDSETDGERSTPGSQGSYSRNQPAEDLSGPAYDRRH